MFHLCCLHVDLQLVLCFRFLEALQKQIVGVHIHVQLQIKETNLYTLQKISLNLSALFVLDESVYCSPGRYIWGGVGWGGGWGGGGVERSC